MAALSLHCCAWAFSSWGEWATLHCCARASHCGGLSYCRAWAVGARASVVVAHRLSCSAACGIFLDQSSNLCPLHWQADSSPLCHQGSPYSLLYLLNIYHFWCSSFFVSLNDMSFLFSLNFLENCGGLLVTNNLFLFTENDFYFTFIFEG